tara:strand:+ start:77 stop:436 length:360 start_codon:yes stop_codon:yes gene_type:complete
MTIGPLDKFAELHNDVEIPQWWSFDFLEYLSQYTEFVVEPYLDEGGVVHTGTVKHDVIVIDDPSDDERSDDERSYDERNIESEEALAQENELADYELACGPRRSDRRPKPTTKYTNYKK